MLILGAQPGVALRMAFHLQARPSFRPEEKNTAIALSKSVAPKTVSALLQRRLQFYPKTFPSKHFYIDQLNQKIVTELRDPLNVLLVAGLGTLLKSEGLVFASQGLLQGSGRILMSPTLQKSSAAVLALGAVACEDETDYQNNFQGSDTGVDMTPDEGVISLDLDGDGVPVGLDCDDANPRKYPLVAHLGEKREDEESVTIRINQDTEVCPGIYSGFTLELANGVKDIEVLGEGVILDGRVNDVPVHAQAIRLSNADNVAIKGFHIQYYDETTMGPGAVRVMNSKAVQLRDLNISAQKGSWPIRLVDSETTLVENVLTSTRSDRGLRAERCQDTLIRASQFSSNAPFDYSSSEYGLLHFEGGSHNTILGSRLLLGQGFGLFVTGSPQFQALELVIQGNQKSGIMLEGVRESNFSKNLVSQNGEYGLYIQANTIDNIFTENNWSSNILGPYGQRAWAGDSTLEQNTFINNTPQP